MRRTISVTLRSGSNVCKAVGLFKECVPKNIYSNGKSVSPVFPTFIRTRFLVVLHCISRLSPAEKCPEIVLSNIQDKWCVCCVVTLQIRVVPERTCPAYCRQQCVCVGLSPARRGAHFAAAVERISSARGTTRGSDQGRDGTLLAAVTPLPRGGITYRQRHF